MIYDFRGKKNLNLFRSEIEGMRAEEEVRRGELAALDKTLGSLDQQEKEYDARVQIVFQQMEQDNDMVREPLVYNQMINMPILLSICL